jgi:putative ABC transport system substrate-binding protein
LRRREFIILLGGAAVSCPRATQAQPIRRIAALMNGPELDPEDQVRLNAFKQGLQQLGWTEGQNIYIDYRHGYGSLDQIRAHAAELVRFEPEVILASTLTVLSVLAKMTRRIPIVFVDTADPVAAGLVSSLARPGNNITGFTNVELSTGSKWLELLRAVAIKPLSRVLVILNSDSPAPALRLPAILAAAPAFGLGLVTADVRNDEEIEREIDTFCQEPNGGLIVLPSPFVGARRNVIITRAGMHHMPSIYPYRFFAASGGLMSYGTDIAAQCRQAASYVDRILKGEKPGELPIQQPTKFELVINLKTAKALGLEIPPTLLALADEVIE